MASFNLQEHSHRRFNLLTGEWIQVSPHRAKRPWQGQEEEAQLNSLPTYDETCYLCPGNPRAGGKQNPNYTNTFVFTNDFSALEADIPEGSIEKQGLLKAQSEKGICRVLCFSPRHDLTLAELGPDQILEVIKLWIKEYQYLGEKDYINYVQIFENKGSVMGCSNPHPHGQIWAQESIPDEPRRESARMEDYLREHQSSMLGDYLKLELELRERVVLENRDFVALVPFWAIWPFETMIISKRHIQNISQFSEDEKRGFADIISRLTIKYDNLFKTSFPYSAGIHQSPTDKNNHPEWHFHMHFYPPLLRSATIKKFMVGYEMLANPQRDITAEKSAQMLAGLPEEHYSSHQQK
jgi:UDPglucose--hexose-1-phosphate uridylyltransferase